MEENKSNDHEKGNNNKAILGIILSIACIVMEVISMICTVAFSRSYDETESGLNAVSFVLMGIALCGQFFGCCAAGKLSNWAVDVGKCDEGLGALCFIVIAILSLPCLGLFQLIAGILITIVTSNNAAANVKAFGGFIAAMNFLSIIPAIVYGIFVYIPVCRSFHD